MSITIELITTDDGFDKLKGAWDLLLTQNNEGNILFEYDWLRTWWKYYGQEGDLYILLICQNGIPIAIVPLMKRRKFGFVSLECIGQEISDFNGMICAADKETIAGQALVDYIHTQKNVDIVRIHRFKENSSTHRGLGPVVRMRRLDVRAPFLDLTKGDIDSKYMTNTLKRGRKLQREQGYTVKDVSSEDLSDRIKKIYGMSKQNEALGDLNDGKKVNFLTEVAEKFKAKGYFSLTILFSKDQIAAAHYGFIYADVYHCYLCALNEDFRDYAVGRILLKDLIFACVERKLRFFDFMFGEEEYKLDWNPQFAVLCSCLIAAKTWKGRVAFFVFDRLIPWIKKCRGQG